METKKTIQECIKEADQKGMQLIIVGAGAGIGKHAELLARMKSKSDVMIVPVGDLTEEDQKKLDSKENMPIQEIIPYRASPIDLKAFEIPNEAIEIMCGKIKSKYLTLEKINKIMKDMNTVCNKLLAAGKISPNP